MLILTLRFPYTLLRYHILASQTSFRVPAKLSALLNLAVTEEMLYLLTVSVNHTYHFVINEIFKLRF